MRKLVPVAASLFATVVASFAVSGASGCSAASSASNDGGASEAGESESGSGSSSGSSGGSDGSTTDGSQDGSTSDGAQDGTTTDGASDGGAGDGTTEGGGGDGGGASPICTPCATDATCASGHCSSFGYCDIPQGPGNGCLFVSSSSPEYCGATVQCYGEADAGGGGDPAGQGRGSYCLCPAPAGGWPVNPPPTTSSAAPWVGTSIAFQGGYNVVSGIWFSSLTQGVVTLTGPGTPEPYDSNEIPPGAVMSMVGPLQAKPTPLYDGFAANNTLGESVNFHGLQQSNYGLVAITDEAWLVGSTDNGNTFTATQTGVASPGSNQAEWFFQDTQHRWTVVEGPTAGNVWETTTATLSATTTWNSQRPSTWNGFDFSQPWNPVMYQSPDGNTIIIPDYSGGAAGTPGVKISTDWGATFPTTVAFPNPPLSSTQNVMVFHDAQHGIVASAYTLGTGVPFVYVTSTGGTSWTAGTLPASARQGGSCQFTGAFYAPDGQHVWLFGDFQTPSRATTYPPLVFASSDGGMTFTDISAGLQNLTAITDVNGNKEYEWDPLVGFALDATHIWLGSVSGALFYSSTGGQ